MWFITSRGRHRPTKPEPPTPTFRYQPYDLNLTWETCRQDYPPLRWWQVRRG